MLGLLLVVTAKPSSAWPASSAGPALRAVAKPLAVWAPLSSIAAGGSAAVGEVRGALTAVIAIVNDCVGDWSTPPLAVPPSSRSAIVIVAPRFWFGAGV